MDQRGYRSRWEGRPRSAGQYQRAGAWAAGRTAHVRDPSGCAENDPVTVGPSRVDTRTVPAAVPSVAVKPLYRIPWWWVHDGNTQVMPLDPAVQTTHCAVAQ